MSDLPPRPAFWPYLPGYALLLLSVLLCASGSYRFVTPMALADGVDLVYLSQGLALLPLGTGLVGLLAGFLLHVRGRWLGALLALLPATLICAWNLYNYAAPATRRCRRVSPSTPRRCSACCCSVAC